MKLGKKEITLKYTISACRKLEQLTGLSIFNMSEYFSTDISLEKILLLLQVGMLHTDPNFNDVDASKLLDKLQSEGETLLSILYWISNSFSKDMNGLLGVTEKPEDKEPEDTEKN
jgi:hypothetical protein